MKKLNEKNKVCIYLDQFVVSCIIDQTNSLWVDIKNLLETNHQQNKIYCPLSPEHFLETVKKEINSAKAHDEYFRKLSDNFLFKDELFLTTQLISSLIRGNKYAINTFLESKLLKKIEDFYNQLNSRNKIFQESVDAKLSLPNEIRKSTKRKSHKQEETDLINLLKLIQVRPVISRLQYYLDKNQIIIRPDNYGKYSFPNWIDQILYQLTNKHKFNVKQFRQLLYELKSHGFDRIPTLNIRFSLGAYIAVKQKQENPSDHIDIMRISNGLISSDVFFTDKKRKFEIQELHLDKEYKTKVFCGIESDLMEFRNYLKDLKDT